MKKLIVPALAAALLLTSVAKAQVNMPAPSPTQTIKQDFGMGSIELTYSRPAIKNRPVFEANSPIAPLDKPWRTGANAATKITFSEEVTIGGQMLKPGSYVIYTVPGKNEWKVVFSKGKAYPGSEGFTESDDVAKVVTGPAKSSDKVESFTMQFANMMPESCDLMIKWGNTAITVPIKTNIKTKLRSQLEAALQGDKKPYFQAATFYYEWDKNLPLALQNVDKAIAENEKAFWMYMLKAKVQKEMGDAAGAKATANKVISLATEAKNDDYVNQANALLSKK